MKLDDMNNQELLNEYARAVGTGDNPADIQAVEDAILNRMNPETAERVKFVVSVEDSELPAFEHKHQDYIDWTLQWHGIDISKPYTVTEVPGGREFCQLGIKRR